VRGAIRSWPSLEACSAISRMLALRPRPVCMRQLQRALQRERISTEAPGRVGEWGRLLRTVAPKLKAVGIARGNMLV
jgi:hypothetical protein